ncbi:unnamed protein product [Pelagomonas calceolata]|uniref:EF-hand domain-containing protein n=3 Tax=Pelagomonas calceolata TaxID=35677 RepID=A0A8J2SI75_9STRA|nr:unnamed protein product [Pelagomonas calceolata]
MSAWSLVGLLIAVRVGAAAARSTTMARRVDAVDEVPNFMKKARPALTRRRLDVGSYSYSYAYDDDFASDSSSYDCVNDDYSTDEDSDSCSSYYDDNPGGCGCCDDSNFASSVQCCACGGGTRCDIVVSGSSLPELHGTYEQKGSCNGYPRWKCDEDGGCDQDQYIWYYSDYSNWHIGPDSCSGSAAIYIGDPSADPDEDLAAVSGTWTEWTGSEWQTNSGISVTCAGAYYSYSYSGACTENCVACDGPGYLDCLQCESGYVLNDADGDGGGSCLQVTPGDDDLADDDSTPGVCATSWTSVWDAGCETVQNGCPPVACDGHDERWCCNEGFEESCDEWHYCGNDEEILPSPDTTTWTERGWCSSGLDEHPSIGDTTTSAEACWSACLEDHGDALVAIDWGLDDQECYCQDDCECMADVEEAMHVVITRDDITELPAVCTSSSGYSYSYAYDEDAAAAAVAAAWRGKELYDSVADNIGKLKAVCFHSPARSPTSTETQFVRLLGLDDVTREWGDELTRRDKLVTKFRALDADGDDSLSLTEFRRVVVSATRQDATADQKLALDP